MKYFSIVEVALVDRRDERQRVHVLEHGARRVVDDAPGAVAPRQAGDRRDSRAPSATSLIVKSNSLPATKSIAVDAPRLPAGSTATFAPIRPALRSGLTAFIASIVLMSDANDGADVCRTARSNSRARARTSASVMPCGGASISLLPRPAPPAARATSDTRTSGSRGAPGSASRRRRRIRRTKAPAGTAYASCVLDSPSRQQRAVGAHPIAVAAPTHDADEKARDIDREGNQVARGTEPPATSSARPKYDQPARCRTRRQAIGRGDRDDAGAPEIRQIAHREAQTAADA